MNAPSPRAFPRLLAALLLCGFGLLSIAQAQDKLTLRADNWFPYNGDPAAAQPSYVVEIVRAVLKTSGGALDYQIMPWKRAVAEAEKGSIDGVIGALETDTPELLFPKEPIGLSGTSAFVRKGSTWRYSGVESLKTQRVGIVEGYSYSEEIDAYTESKRADPKALDVSGGDTPETLAIKKLQAGRIDVYLSDPNVFHARARELGFKEDDFVNAGTVAAPLPIYISLNPRRPESRAWADKLDQGIRALRDSGELATILKRYGLEDWAKR
jgi:polar amino acid transport system substrate-binding protein